MYSKPSYLNTGTSFSECSWNSHILSFVVQSLSRVRLFVTPWTAACQASPSFTIPQSLLKLMSIGSVMPSNHLVLCQIGRASCRERVKAGGEKDNKGWDVWMASPTQWTWVWVSSGSWWWTRKPGILQSMGSQRVRHDWVTELNW